MNRHWLCSLDMSTRSVYPYISAFAMVIMYTFYAIHFLLVVYICFVFILWIMYLTPCYYVQTFMSTIVVVNRDLLFSCTFLGFVAIHVKLRFCFLSLVVAGVSFYKKHGLDKLKPRIFRTITAILVRSIL